jgi:predicted dehydrogenase
MSQRNNRRQFLKQTALAGVGFWVAGTATDVYANQPAERRRPGPNDRLNIGVIGCGGQGGSNLRNVARTENIVALCDVDEQRAASAYTAHPKATRYHDFRVMLEKQRDLDAVVVSTPDNLHFHASMTAIRLGKHVYTEKPLTHDIWEARQLKEAAAKHRVATQMGNQGTSTPGMRRGVEMIRAGAIGEVREVHVWTNRPIWPQGIGRPAATPPVPQTLHWDLWIGPAPFRPYNPAYAPFAWRGWWDFGTGALGDMACHTMNLPYMALRLGPPRSVSVTEARHANNETYPEGCTIVYEFPARGELPPVRLTWYERGRPPAALFQGQQQRESGSLMIGSRGTMLTRSDYGDNNILLPVDQFRDYQAPEATLPRSPGHHAEWLRACKGGSPAMSNFTDYAGPLTEMVLLGNVALRVNQQINWDSANLRVTNNDQANRYLRREYRKGWNV